MAASQVGQGFSTGEFRADLFTEVRRQVPAVLRRPVHVVEVEVQRHGVGDGTFQLAGGRHLIEAELDWAERRGGYGEQELAVRGASRADQERLGSPEVRERESPEGKG